MPTYQYACTECGEQLEVVQKFSDEPLTVCPACQGRLRKVFSAVGVVFKGSGFYKTDSRSSSSSGSPSTSAPAKTAEGGKSETKSDTKSESKSDAKSDTASTKSGSSSGGSDSKVA
jgi:putative FmdB family regulatory protein